MTRSVEQIAVGLVLGSALALRLFVANRPIEWLVKFNLHDDAFYYFVTARHIVSDGVVSFDGTNITNGFHPLWMLLAVCAYWLVPGSATAPIHLLIGLAAVFDAAAGWLVYITVRRLTSSALASVVAMTTYVFAAEVLPQHANGLESSLSALAVAGLIALLGRVAITHPRARGGIALHLLLGIICAICLLARTDNIFLVIASGIAWLALHTEIERSLDRARGRSRLRTTGEMAIAIGTTCALLSPWLLWNLRHFGTIMQVSGTVAATAQTGQPWAFSVLWAAFSHLLRVTGIPITAGVAPLFWGLPILIAGGAWLVSRPADGNRPRPHQALFRETVIGVVLPTLAAMLMLASIHALWRGGWRAYYALSLAPATAVLSGILLAWALKGIGQFTAGRHSAALSGAIRVGLVAWILLFCTARPNALWLRRGVLLTPWQADMFDAATWIRTNLPRDRVVGSFNAGVIGYFSDRKVVNLDGVINNSAFQATVERRLSDYICAQGVSTIADTLPAKDSLEGPAYGRPLKVDPIYVKESVCQTEYQWCSRLTSDYRIVDLRSSVCESSM